MTDRCGRGHLTWASEPPCEVCELLELAEEGWSYASEYFQGKWDFRGRLAGLKARLANHPADDQDGKVPP